MNRDIFDPSFELQDSRLDRLGNPLVELERTIDWETFHPLLGPVHQKERKSQAGAPTRDAVMMFKGLVIQNLCGLSDEQLEYQIEDRRDFHDIALASFAKHQCTPDQKTFGSFRNRLSELKLIESLFEQFSAQLHQADSLARKGQIIDASLIPVPIQHETQKRKRTDYIKRRSVALAPFGLVPRLA